MQFFEIENYGKLASERIRLTPATGVFSDSWKIARMALILKSGQSNGRPNYRPISVLPFLSRVFENLI